MQYRQSQSASYRASWRCWTSALRFGRRQEKRPGTKKYVHCHPIKLEFITFHYFKFKLSIPEDERQIHDWEIHAVLLQHVSPCWPPSWKTQNCTIHETYTFRWLSAPWAHHQSDASRWVHTQNLFSPYVTGISLLGAGPFAAFWGLHRAFAAIRALGTLRNDLALPPEFVLVACQPAVVGVSRCYARCYVWTFATPWPYSRRKYVNFISLSEKKFSVPNRT